MRILSGIQPSGALHLGNYFGMMQRMIRYQETSDLFCFIANYDLGEQILTIIVSGPASHKC